MNKDNAKDFLPLVQAMAEGKEIQMRDHNNEWNTDHFPYFSGPPQNYRIKPEPRKPREWTKWASDYNGGKTLYNGRVPGASEKVRVREIIEE